MTAEMPMGTITVAVVSLNRERRFSFCLPERGGDANVYNIRVSIPDCRICARPFDLHRP